MSRNRNASKHIERSDRREHITKTKCLNHTVEHPIDHHLKRVLNPFLRTKEMGVVGIATETAFLKRLGLVRVPTAKFSYK